MNNGTYRLVAGFFDAFLWGGELVETENLPESGPVVYVANHSGALGPIAVIASLPVRVYPWVIADMLDRDLAADYMNQDFVQPQLHLRPPLSLWVSKQVSKISVPLLNSAGSVPVYKGERLLETYSISLDLLAEGKSLLVFPEDPDQGMDPASQMTPFKKGFARLGEGYYQRTAKPLCFCPLAVHIDSFRVHVGDPITYNMNNHPRNECLRVKTVLEAKIRRMYLDMAMEHFLGIPLHH